MRLVKCVRGKGLFANPTGGVEFQPTWGCVPLVVAGDAPSADCLGVFISDFPRVVSVGRYRIAQRDSGDTRMLAPILRRNRQGVVTGWTM
jgi:hypothetical protein